MLISCSDCKQVVEISALRSHLQDECEFKSRYSVCSRCGDVILATNLRSHTASDVCTATTRPQCQCPLCHLMVGDSGSDAEWQRHLVTEGCTANPRS